MRYLLIQSTRTEKVNAQKSNQRTSAGFQPGTQSTFVNINPNTNNTKNLESIFPNDVTGISSSTSFAPTLGITVPV